MIIFGVILIYIIISIVIYFKSDKIVGYEVKEGSLAVSNTFNAFAVRNEEIFYSDYSGYVNYYVQEGERVADGKLVYTVDESNKLSSLLESSADSRGNALDENSLSSIQTQIIQFQKEFSSFSYDRIYLFKNNIQSILLKLANYTMINNIDIVSYQGLDDNIHFGYSSQSAVISYCIDGYEDISLETISADCFDTTQYQKNIFYNNDIISLNEPVYKLSMDETWYLVIQLTDKQYSDLLDITYLNVQFLDTGYVSTASFHAEQRTDGYYGFLEFHDSMIQYASERYVSTEIETDEETGLKIPLSSIVEKEFYLIPTEYLTKGGKNSKDGVNRLSYDDDGKTTSEFVEVTVYSEAENEYYVDQSSLRIGDTILLNDSSETFIITKSGTLIGVYNMNKGYADFRQISILYQNDDYAIVRPNTQYGLIIYDYIVLDAGSVDEDDFIY